jgi:mRNA-degrading endonuclease toxin of MazEF toxin-antitoxin module
MIIGRYERPVDRVEPTVSDPILQERDWLLDDPPLLALLRRELRQHYSPAPCGRHSVPVEVLLRLTVLRRVKRWSYRQAEQEVRDSLPYRWWVRVYDRRVPGHSTLNDLERVIQPRTLQRLNDRVLQAACEAHLTRGYRLRVESRVTESNIHYPTESTLLVEGVRSLSRHLEHAKPLLAGRLSDVTVLSHHPRRARRRARRIGQLSRPGKTGAQGTRRAEAKKSLAARVCRTERHCSNPSGPSPPREPGAWVPARGPGAAGSAGLGVLHACGRTSPWANGPARVVQRVTASSRGSGQSL